MNLYEKLSAIQSKLKAPKNQYNSFGKYNYRSCEDILEGLKPLLLEYKATVTLSDEIKQIGDRYYLEATATFVDTEKGDKIEVKALAREDETKKGMFSTDIVAKYKDLGLCTQIEAYQNNTGGGRGTPHYKVIGD